MKKLLVILALSAVASTFGDDFFPQIIPNNTAKLIIRQAVKEAKAYTDSKISTNKEEFVESDPTVAAWAKSESKPTYNASEIIYGNGFVGDFLSELTGTVATKADTADLTAISTAVVGKADKTDVYTKAQADQTFLTSHQDLSGYATKDSVYTKDEADAKYQAILTKLSLLEATVALLGGNNDVIEADGKVTYNDPTKSVALSGSIASTNGASITAKKVAMSGVSGAVSPVTQTGADIGLLVAAESVNLANSELTGTTQKSSNLIEVRGADTMVIKDTTFTGDTYNTLMTGQRTTGFLKELTIENCVFDENCKHINIWFAGFQDNAVLTIKNCTFKTCEQFLCISDHQGAVANNLTVNIENVTIQNYEVGDAYEGIMLVDDRVCTSEAQLRSVNPFSKVKINLKNVTAGGVKLTQANFGIGTGTTGQQLYYYSKSGGGVYPYNETNASLFPTVTVTE